MRTSTAIACSFILIMLARPVRAQAVREVPSPDFVPSTQLRSQTIPPVRDANAVPNSQAGVVEQTAPATVESSGVRIEEITPPEFSPAINDESALSLPDVIASVYRSFPEIARARLQRSVAQGELTSAFGSYDTKLEGYSVSEPVGFYQNFRNGIGVARRTWWGGYLSAGYRIGRGDFQPWYKERETDKGGEFKIGLGLPLLQGRAIDPQRLAVFQASLAARAVDPQVQQSLLDASLEASFLYWEWVASGARLEAQQELLELATTRGEQFQAGYQAGKFAKVDVLLNDALIAERQSKLLEAERKLRASSFKLSMFLRDADGIPMIPDDALLPKHFPQIDELPDMDYLATVAAAISRRPEIALLEIESRSVNLDRSLARNQTLPRLDLMTEAKDDVGDLASSLGDKEEFELIVGLEGELPIQRRKARGKIQSTTAKLAQINQKMRLQRDKIGVEIQTAFNALEIAAQVLEQAELGLLASFETLEIYRFAFQRGKSDLIYLNLLESKANEAELKVVDAQRNWFLALAELQLALALDPLEQALRISSLPPSNRPGPGNLPPPLSTLPDDFDADWEKRQGNREE